MTTFTFTERELDTLVDALQARININTTNGWNPEGTDRARLILSRIEPRGPREYPNAPDYVNQPGFPEPDEALPACTNTQTHPAHDGCAGVDDPFALLPDVD